jgi:hypothetical protein
VLFSGEAGWPAGSTRGICHAEFSLAQEKLRELTLSIDLRPFFKGEQEPIDKAFESEISRYTMAQIQAKDYESLRSAILEHIHAFVRVRFNDALDRWKRENLLKPASQPSRDWSHHTYRERATHMLDTLRTEVQKIPVFEQQFTKLHVVPDSLSVSDARSSLGRPFLLELDDFEAIDDLKAGTMHLTAIYGNATQTQVKSILGFPDIAVSQGSFGFYLWEKTSHIQMVFLAKCQTQAAIVNQLTRFNEWLITSGEIDAIQDRGRKRYEILNVMHKNRG